MRASKAEKLTSAAAHGSSTQQPLKGLSMVNHKADDTQYHHIDDPQASTRSMTSTNPTQADTTPASHHTTATPHTARLTNTQQAHDKHSHNDDAQSLMRNSPDDTLERQEVPLRSDQSRSNHRISRHLVIRMDESILIPEITHALDQSRHTYNSSIPTL